MFCILTNGDTLIPQVKQIIILIILVTNFVLSITQTEDEIIIIFVVIDGCKARHI